MPRAKSFDRKEALTKAMELFWEKGYASTSLQDLTECMGIGKGSFYATFESKESLFTDTLELYKEINRNEVLALLEAEKDVKQGLRKLLLHNLEQLLDSETSLSLRWLNSYH